MAEAITGGTRKIINSTLINLDQNLEKMDSGEALIIIKRLEENFINYNIPKTKDDTNYWNRLGKIKTRWANIKPSKLEEKVESKVQISEPEREIKYSGMVGMKKLNLCCSSEKLIISRKYTDKINKDSGRNIKVNWVYTKKDVLDRLEIKLYKNMEGSDTGQILNLALLDYFRGPTAKLNYKSQLPKDMELINPKFITPKNATISSYEKYVFDTYHNLFIYGHAAARELEESIKLGQLRAPIRLWGDQRPVTELVNNKGAGELIKKIASLFPYIERMDEKSVWIRYGPHLSRKA